MTFLQILCNVHENKPYHIGINELLFSLLSDFE